MSCNNWRFFGGYLTNNVTHQMDEWCICAYLSVLKNEETHVLPVVNFILSEDWGGVVLDPDPCQFVAVDLVVLKLALEWWSGEGRGEGRKGVERGRCNVHTYSTLPPVHAHVCTSKPGHNNTYACPYLAMIVHKHTNVVGIGDGTVWETWVGAPPTYVDTRATERCVGEVAVVDKRSTVFGNLNTVLSDVWRVCWRIKLNGREGGRERGKRVWWLLDSDCTLL